MTKNKKYDLLSLAREALLEHLHATDCTRRWTHLLNALDNYSFFMTTGHIISLWLLYNNNNNNNSIIIIIIILRNKKIYLEILNFHGPWVIRNLELSWIMSYHDFNLFTQKCWVFNRKESLCWNTDSTHAIWPSMTLFSQS